MAVLKDLAKQLRNFIHNKPPPPTVPDQRVEQRVEMRQELQEDEAGLEQRVSTPIPMPDQTYRDIKRAQNASATRVANNPTAPRVLQTTTRTHQHLTRNNTPGALPKIVRANIIEDEPPP